MGHGAAYPWPELLPLSGEGGGHIGRSEASSLPPCRSQSLSSGQQAWQQAPLPAGPSCQPPSLSNPWNRSSVDRKGRRKEAQKMFRNRKSPHIVLKEVLRVQRYQTSSNANIESPHPRINTLWLHSSFSANAWCAPKYNVSFIRHNQEQGQMNPSQAGFKHSYTHIHKAHSWYT